MPDLARTSPNDLDTVRQDLEAALKDQGFGILSEIDVQAIFKQKLDVDHEGHRILGVCNPNFGKEVLDVDRDLALLLPCPVTLHEVESGTEVKVLDPERVFGLATAEQQQTLNPLAREVRERLDAALRQAVPTPRSA
ncbi:MAG: DUF302 domain-containing protein [Trueperaceae bacterium]|nr:DUF302 domain-containing protein [Trueperaceae bacterium]